MALITLTQVKFIPGMANLSDDFLNLLIASADRAVKDYLKRDIESATYTEYHDGDNTPYIQLFQRPVSNTGVSVWVDFNGNYGQTANSFSANPLTQGQQYAVILDGYPFGLPPLGNVQVSNCGLIQRIGGGGIGSFAWWGTIRDNWGQGKLAGTKLPYWPYGIGNIKVTYTAGYTTIPADLTYATGMLIAYMGRVMPAGAPLSSENLGAYSYQVAQITLQSAPPEIGSIARTLALYRDSVW